MAAAAELGWPVVLKTAAPGVQHKSDVGGVVVGSPMRTRCARPTTDLAARLGPAGDGRRAGARPASSSRSASCAIRTFGPLVLVAAGGVLVELLDDRKLALPPLDEAGARRLIDRPPGPPAAGRASAARPRPTSTRVAHAVSRLSVLAADLGDLLDALDVNPVIAGPDGCVAVDALVVPR